MIVASHVTVIHYDLLLFFFLFLYVGVCELGEERENDFFFNEKKKEWVMVDFFFQERMMVD